MKKVSKAYSLTNGISISYITHPTSTRRRDDF